MPVSQMEYEEDGQRASARRVLIPPDQPSQWSTPTAWSLGPNEDADPQQPNQMNAICEPVDPENEDLGILLRSMEEEKRQQQIEQHRQQQNEQMLRQRRQYQDRELDLLEQMQQRPNNPLQQQIPEWARQDDQNSYNPYNTRQLYSCLIPVEDEIRENRQRLQWQQQLFDDYEQQPPTDYIVANSHMNQRPQQENHRERQHRERLHQKRIHQERLQWERRQMQER
ncbi:uncharacterized protein Dwil_GK28150, partial [Drosophila willistoni]